MVGSLLVVIARSGDALLVSLWLCCCCCCFAYNGGLRLSASIFHCQLSLVLLF